MRNLNTHSASSKAACQSNLSQEYLLQFHLHESGLNIRQVLCEQFSWINDISIFGNLEQGVPVLTLPFPPGQVWAQANKVLLGNCGTSNHTSHFHKVTEAVESVHTTEIW